MDCQDWTEVKIVRRRLTVGSPGTVSGTSTRQHVAKSSEAANAWRIENEEESRKPKYLSPESRQELLKARLAKKWSQQELNMQCAFPKNLIADIEAGRIQPTGSQLNTINRVLKLSLKFVL